MPEAECITIRGITYTVMSAETPESEDAAGRPNLAGAMRQRGQLRHVYLRRGARGHAMYMAVQYARGYSIPVSVGVWGDSDTPAPAGTQEGVA